VNLYWSWIALTAAMGMTLRYLKFFSHFAVEVFTAYAYKKDAARGSKLKWRWTFQANPDVSYVALAKILSAG